MAKKGYSVQTLARMPVRRDLPLLGQREDHSRQVNEALAKLADQGCSPGMIVRELLDHWAIFRPVMERLTETGVQILEKQIDGALATYHKPRF